MRRNILELLWLCLVMLLGVVGFVPDGACAATELYVAIGGSDSWSGRLAEPNAEQTDGPLASLAQARDAIRAMKKAGGLPPGGVTVFVRAGLYELAETLELAAQDSGTEAAPVVYRAYPGEKPVLTGTRRITGFVPHRGRILKADVAAQGLKDCYFRQLFFDGKRQVLARYPNFDPANPYAGGYAYVDGPLPNRYAMYHDQPDDSAEQFRYRARDARTWAHPEQGEVSLFPRYNWMNDIVPIGSVDTESRLIHLARKIRTPGSAAIRPYDRYYVRNLMEELDTAGEWYLDKQTWTLYFRPPEAPDSRDPAKPIEEAEVRAPALENLVQIGWNAAWITLRGFTMEGCDGSAVSLTGAKDCLVAGNTIHNTGGRLGPAAINICRGYRCGAVGNDIFDVCNTGIRLYGGDNDKLTPGEHYAENNYLHHIGLLSGHGHGVSLQGVGLRASHNLIHDTTRSAIFGGGTDCLIEYNHIRHVNLETEDTGGRYGGGCWHIRGTVIRYNLVHDTLGYGRCGDRWVSPYYSWGIYLDDDQSYTHVYGNIVARTTAGGCHIHAGRNNVVENNIFIDSSGQQVQYSGHSQDSSVVARHLQAFEKARANPAYQAKYPGIAETDPKTVWHMAENKTFRNIICYRGPESALYKFRHHKDNPFEQNEIDHNLVWHFGLPISVSGNGKSMTWEEWREQGYDTHSEVADPLFVDADNDDYRLRPESPALKMGFEPIPVDKIGLYEDELRASWPIVEVEGVREHPLPAARILLWPESAPVGDGSREEAETVLTAFLPPRKKATGAAVVICPGGGYMRLVLSREGPIVARWLADHGIAGIVLEYRMPEGRPYVPLLDAQRAVRVVRSHAEDWNLDPQRIGIMGFSAGGHLASTAGTHFDAGNPEAADPIDQLSCRPDFMVLIYPVVTMGEKTHGGSKKNLLGADPKPELVELFSNEKQVTDQTPPTFLAHAKDDRAVPPENSRALRDALKARGVAVEYLEVPEGGHGLFGCKGPVWEKWKTRSLEWMAAQGIIPNQATDNQAEEERENSK